MAGYTEAVRSNRFQLPSESRGHRAFRLTALPWSRGIDRNGTRALLLAAASYVAFGLLDCVTTAVALSHGGREGNPLAASLYERFGVASLFAFKGIVIAIILAVVTILPRRPAAWIVTSFAAAVAFAVVGNLHAILRLS
jgi:Domain of unknown function (DUF5658)